MKKILKSVLRVNLTAMWMIVATIITIGDLMLAPITVLIGCIIARIKGLNHIGYLELLFAGFSAWFSKEHYTAYMSAIDEFYQTI